MKFLFALRKIIFSSFLVYDRIQKSEGFQNFQTSIPIWFVTGIEFSGDINRAINIWTDAQFINDKKARDSGSLNLFSLKLTLFFFRCFFYKYHQNIFKMIENQYYPNSNSNLLFGISRHCTIKLGNLEINL